MNTTKTTTMLAALALGLCLAAHVALAQQQNKGDVLLQEARHKEIIDGNLEEAISLYQKIVDNVSDIGRAVAARALVQMGKSYEKLGVHLVAEARQAYEQVVRDYPDQPDMVAEAQSRLEAFQAAVTDAAGPDQPKGLTVRRVTPIQNRQAGEVSPDGRYVSFANYATGNMAVYNVRTGEHRDITNDGTWDEEPYQFGDTSLWSSDSKQLAYGWFVGSRWSLRIVDMDGGEPRIIAPFSEEGVPWPQAWSQDGKYILALNLTPNQRSDRIVLVDVETGSTRTIKELPDGRTLMNMSLSPDGKYVLYESFTTDQRESRNINILSTDGQLDQPLIDHPANDRDPTWTPDGRHLLFAKRRQTGSHREQTGELWRIPA
ncbi:MAG: PD40 domain-containing protein, partial [Bacteroidetes bacterium]|nr:PD40 domain-containing protein [Bacteroidota bacterium]